MSISYYYKLSIFNIRVLQICIEQGVYSRRLRAHEINSFGANNHAYYPYSRIEEMLMKSL